MSRKQIVVTIVVVVAGFAFVAAFTPRLSTISDLQKAFAAEETTRARYAQYAAEAEREGYFGAASLFRAVGTAEAIHASHHGKLINSMGDIPAALPERTRVASTRDNLRAALAGEEQDRDELYPRLLNYARDRHEPRAADSLSLALHAEEEHARLFAGALANLEALTKAETFSVCTSCGFVAKDTRQLCPACGCRNCTIDVR